MGIYHDEHRDYASKGVAGTGLGLGIAGTALALLNNGGWGGLGGILGGWGGGAQGAAIAANSAYIAQKDAEIAQLKSEKYADRNTLDLFRYVDGKFAAVENQLATLTCQVNRNSATLGEITKIGVPNTVLIPGVPAVTITHGTTATAQAA